jgi:alkanesulfonate monooxygenase SsuD/methylene tetrahydromethanopterin reductase-like flavin-dependent oxidoreductase (luciferase family)
MGSFEVGLVLPVSQFGPERTTPRWTEMREMVRVGEEAGLDTIWIADELLWQVEGASPQGAWDGVSIIGAVAAITSRISRLMGAVCAPSQSRDRRQDRRDA